MGNESTPPSNWAAHATGPATSESLSALVTTDAATLSGAELTDAIVASEKALSLLAGLQIRFMAALAQPFVAGDPMRLAARLARKNNLNSDDPERTELCVPEAATCLAASEIAAALRISPITAGIRVRDAAAMTTELSATLQALEQGRIDRGKSRVIADHCQPLSPDHIAQVQDLVLPTADQLSTSELREITGQAVITVDPAGAEERHQAAAARRELTLSAQPDAMATLKAFLPADGAVKIFQISDLLATSTAGVPGDPRGIGARRIDALVDIAEQLLAHGYLDITDYIDSPAPDHAETKAEGSATDTEVCNPNANTDSAVPDSGETCGAECVDAETSFAETDRGEPDSGEPDSTEPDSTETDVTETDGTETDSAESDSAESDSAESNSGESDSAETDGAESNSGESDSAQTTPFGPGDSPSNDMEDDTTSTINIQPDHADNTGLETDLTEPNTGESLDIETDYADNTDAHTHLTEPNTTEPDTTESDSDNHGSVECDSDNPVSTAVVSENFLPAIRSTPEQANSESRPGDRRALSRQGRRPHLSVIIGWATLTGENELPAKLAGFGAIPASLGRAIATSAGTVTALFADRVSGVVTEAGALTYRPSQQLRDRVAALTPTCQFPSCRQPVWRCDIDHRESFDHHNPDRGGHTDSENTGPLCRRHHLLKHHTEWRFRVNPERFLIEWISPTGHRYSKKQRPSLPADLRVTTAGAAMAERLDMVTAFTAPSARRSEVEELLTTLLLHHQSTQRPVEYIHEPSAWDLPASDQADYRAPDNTAPGYPGPEDTYHRAPGYPGPEPEPTDPDGSRPDGSRPDGSRPDGSRPDGSRPDDAPPF